MKRIRLVSALLIAGVSASFYGQSAKEVSQRALEFETAGESIDYLKKTIPSVDVASEKRALFNFLGLLQEQLSAYKDASDSYAAAAGISAGDAEGMQKKTNTRLVLDAVRCALCAGDSSTAESYLNSAVRNSSDGKIQADIKLYEIWSKLCKIDSAAQLDESVALLKAYSDLPSMESVRPSILLTLWYVTGEKSFGGRLKSDFPKSPEAAIVGGSVQMMPAPFWYFMPKKGQALATAAEAAAESQTVPVEKSAESDSGDTDSSGEKIKKQQLGLFKNRANADSLIETLKSKGFRPYIMEETRPSGTTYYIVVVDENPAGNMGDQLRSAGFECYPVF